MKSNSGRRTLVVVTGLLVLASLCVWQWGLHGLAESLGISSETASQRRHDHENHAKEERVHHDGDEQQRIDETHSDEVRVHMPERTEGGFPIELAKAGPGKLSTSIEVPGEIVMDADHLAHVTPLLPGVVIAVKKRLGDTVRRGDLMAIIESRELADAKAAWLAASERLELAQATFDREALLWEKGITAKQEYLDAKKSLSEARIEKKSAEQKLRFLGLSNASINGLEKDPAGSLTQYRVIAPIDGTVVRKSISLGQKVSEEDAIFTIADLTRVWVDLTVPQKDLGFVRPGQKTRILFEFGAPDADATIAYVSPMLDRGTRTALARVVLSNPDGTYRPGLFVRARISLGEKELPVVAPMEALQRLGHETVIFVKEGDGFEPRRVSAGRSDGFRVEIVSGLSEGETYVAQGGFELKSAMLTRDMESHAGHGH